MAKKAATTDEKLEALAKLDMTSAEIGLAAGVAPSAVEERRRLGSADSAYTLLDDGVDALCRIAAVLVERQVPAANVRGFFIGRSAYLEEQRPAVLMSLGHFELVRDAAIAYATGETPSEFRSRVGPILHMRDPLEP